MQNKNNLWTWRFNINDPVVLYRNCYCRGIRGKQPPWVYCEMHGYIVVRIRKGGRNNCSVCQLCLERREPMKGSRPLGWKGRQLGRFLPTLPKICAKSAFSEENRWAFLYALYVIVGLFLRKICMPSPAYFLSKPWSNWHPRGVFRFFTDTP